MLSFLGKVYLSISSLYNEPKKIGTKTKNQNHKNEKMRQQRERQKHAIPPVIQSIMMKKRKNIESEQIYIQYDEAATGENFPTTTSLKLVFCLQRKCGRSKEDVKVASLMMGR